METLITVEQARKLIQEQVLPLSPVTVEIQEAIGLVLAEDIFAKIDVPSFPQSNMDGYAFAFKEGETKYQLMGEQAAGSDQKLICKDGTAIRIFTGAAVPFGADTILMQEKALVKDGYLIIPENGILQGDHLRPVGSEIKKGDLALAAGIIINPASIGFLASIGIDKIDVFPMPKLAILVTGNELQKPGLPLNDGQVYESNSYTLSAALSQMQIKHFTIAESKDDLTQLIEQLENSWQHADILLITGGVSVGDYDFTLQALQQCGVEIVFHKIKQKPGKPLLFGRRGNQIVFGLPGNPASVLTCFYEYVLPALGLIAKQKKSLKELKVPITHDFKKPAGLTHILRANFQHEEVTILTGQESYKLSAYVLANCLAILPEQDSQLMKGDLIKIHLLPN